MTIESCLDSRNLFVGGNINIPSARIRVQCAAVGDLSSWEGLPFRESQPHFNPTFLPAAAWTSPGKSVSLTGAAAASLGFSQGCAGRSSARNPFATETFNKQALKTHLLDSHLGKQLA
jgi:hypothetical protein